MVTGKDRKFVAMSSSDSKNEGRSGYWSSSLQLEQAEHFAQCTFGYMGRAGWNTCREGSAG